MSGGQTPDHCSGQCVHHPESSRFSGERWRQPGSRRKPLRLVRFACSVMLAILSTRANAQSNQIDPVVKGAARSFFGPQLATFDSSRPVDFSAGYSRLPSVSAALPSFEYSFRVDTLTPRKVDPPEKPAIPTVAYDGFACRTRPIRYHSASDPSD